MGLGVAFLAVSCIVPGAAVAQPSGRDADVDLVVQVIRELFPEVQTQTRLAAETGGPRVHLTATVGFSKAHDRIVLAHKGLRKFSGGAVLGEVHDQWQSGVVRATVRARGGWIVGSFQVDRQGMGIEVDVYSTAKLGGASGGLPALSVVPEPLMWLFPL